MTLSLQRDFGQEIILYTTDGEIRLWFAKRDRRAGLTVGIDAPPSVQILRAELVEKKA